MMFLQMLTEWVHKRSEVKCPKCRPSARLRLEQLEDRVVPSFMTNTYTNASVQITPGFIVTETVTAQVTPFVGFNSVPGSPGTTPIPAGATNPTGGTVIFNLNNLQQAATVNSNGQATATFQVPFLAFLTSQTLSVNYQGFTDGSGNQWFSSSFVAPLYKNFDNLIFVFKNLNVLPSSTITFNQLTPQQVYADKFQEYTTNPATFPATTSPPYNTANGETDSLFNGLVVFNYVDPGTINTVTVLGLAFSGSVASQLGAFSGLPHS
jgi:hypothetical protein